MTVARSPKVPFKAPPTPAYFPITYEFWPFLLSCLSKPKADETEVNRARACGAWLEDHLSELQRKLNGTECIVIGTVFEHYRQHKRMPTLQLLMNTLKKEDSVVATMVEDELTPDTIKEIGEPVEPADLPALLLPVLEAHRTEALKRLAAQTAAIASPQGLKLSNGTILQGEGKALAYLEKEVMRGAIPDYGSERPTSGTLQSCREFVGRVLTPGIRKPHIPTGLVTLDEHLKARPGHFIGILAFAKMGKTRLARTWAYNAALLGRNVLFYSLESSFEEEVLNFNAIHAWSRFPEEAKRLDITLSRIQDDMLTPAACQFLSTTVQDDLGNGGLPGKLHLREANENADWGSVVGAVDRASTDEDLDMLIVDYLQILEMEGRDERAATSSLLAQVKRWSNANQVLTVSPVQASKAGALERAAANGGRYDAGAVDSHTSYVRNMDAIVGVFMGKEQETKGHVIISSVAQRRGTAAEPFEAKVHFPTQTLSASSNVAESGFDYNTLEDL